MISSWRTNSYNTSITISSCCDAINTLEQRSPEAAAEDALCLTRAAPDLKPYNSVWWCVCCWELLPSPPLLCSGRFTRFTPNSFNICLAYSSNFCHHHKRRHLRRSEARALTPPRPPSPSTPEERESLLNHFWSRKPPLFLFIYDFVPENWVFVIGYLIYSSGFHCNICSIVWVYIDSTCTLCSSSVYSWVVASLERRKDKREN